MTLDTRAVVLALPLLLLPGCGEDEAGGAATPAVDSSADSSSADAPPLAPEDSTSSDTVDAARAQPGRDENFGVVESQGHPDCEGLNASHCLLPFPSDRFRVSDAQTVELAFGPESLPETAFGGRLDREAFRQRDGYSPVTPVLFRFPGATLQGTASVLDIDASLAPDSPTVVLDAESGDRVAHWVEHDHFTVAGDAPVTTLRFPTRLAFGRRYVVAVRGLVDAAGLEIEADPGFAALRDQTASAVVGVHARRARFEEEVFGALEAAGVERAGLQLAFDFTVASQPNSTARLTVMRDRMLEAIGAQGPEYTVQDVIELPEDPYLAVRVEVVAHVPSFLLPPDAQGVRRLRLDDDGQPTAEGFEDVPVEVQIPKMAFGDGAPTVALLQYGHGLFGSRAEARKGWLRQMAAERGFAIVSADMQGMSEADIGVWGVVLTGDVSAFPHVAEQPLQGLCNHLAIARMMAQRFALDDDSRFTRAGTPVLDPARLYYYGNSQGGTLGALLMSLQPDIQRGVLGVPGGAYALLLNRSTAFSEFAGIIKIPFPDPVDFAVVFGLLQTGFDHMDPLSYVQHITSEPLPGAPTHRVLLQVAREDSQVHNQVSFLLGRSIGASLMVPTPREVWGFDTQPYPYEGNAVVEYDFNKPPNPNPTAPAPAKHDTHGDLRVLPAGQAQLLRVLETGEVINPCDGACDPE